MKKIILEHKIGILKILSSIILITLALIFSSFENSLASFICYLISYCIMAYEIIIDALKSLIKDHDIGEELLMSVASIGAMIIGEYFEAVLVIVLYCVGEMFEDIATDSSRRSIETLVSIRPDKARIRFGDIILASKVEIGEIIEVYPGERIPLDGTVVDSVGNVDTSVITGESTPIEVRNGSEVLAGCLNCNSVLYIKVMRHLDKSAAQRIIDLSEKAMEKKTKSEKFIKVFAKFYTPIVILLAIIIAIVPPIFDNYNFSIWIYKAISLLAISCPCAIVISVPLAYYCGIAYACKKGILIKGSCTIDALAKIKTIAFDKTGTLTKPELHVTKIEPVHGTEKAELLKYVSIVEMKSTHPIALAVIQEARKFNISPAQGENYKESVGFGVECDSEYGHIKAGNKEYVESPEEAHGNILVSLNGRYVGSVTLGDELKPNSKIAFEKLKHLGIKNRIIVSGDKKAKVKIIARSLLAEKAYSDLNPEQKLEIIESLIDENNGKVAYCGDGINDTPSLARADVGIAMGALGSDSAVECSDVVIMDDDIEKIPKAFQIAKHTKRTVVFNLAISILVKLVMFILCTLGYVNLLGAVIADVGVLIFAIICALLAGR